jgi:hypothetical protein
MFAKEKANDYVEMVLHHIVTVYLFAFSHFTNTIVGGLVLLIHDSGDICIGFSRIFSETHNVLAVKIFFSSNCFIFAYTRLLIFPYVVYVSIIKIPVYAVSPYMQPIFGFLMTCLFILHCYWFVLFLKIISNYCKTGHTEDLANKT